MLRLTDGSTIARFHCVNKQWRRLLSDSKFINQILWSDDEKKETTNVLIQHHHEHRRVYRDRLFYSVHTFDQKDERLTPSQTTTENHKGLRFRNVQLVPEVVRLSSESRFSIIGNDLWRVSDRVDFASDDFRIYGHRPPTRHVAQSYNSGRRQVYWHSNEAIESFDMTDEMFDTGHKFPRKFKTSTTKKGDECITDQVRMQTTQKEFMMLAIFGSSRRVYEIWGLLDYWKPESWTKLFAVSRFRVSNVRIGLGPLGTHGRCLLFFKKKNIKKMNKLMTLDPETEEIKNIYNHRAMDISEWEMNDSHVVTYCYVPFQISISDLNSAYIAEKNLFDFLFF
ncbi:hypothetical protein LINPERHAP2_LOCUS41354 [Linum perenne]